MARRVPPGSAVADVGTDHALLLIWLLQQDLVCKAIGIELTERSIAKARANAIEFRARVDLRVGYGLNPVVAGEAGVLVLCGLGGETIVEVLTGGADVARQASTVIAQPMKDAAQLVRWAGESGMTLLHDDIVRDRAWMYRVLTFGTGTAFKPSLWSPRETGIEHEVTKAMLRNDPGVLAHYLARRLRIRKQVRDHRYGTNEFIDTDEDGTLTAIEAVIAKLNGEC